MLHIRDIYPIYRGDNMLKKISMLTLFSVCTSFAVLPSLQAQDCGQYCTPCCYDPCDTCCDRFWVDADYLYWKIKDSPESVPLVVEVPLIPGPNTTVLGGSKIKNNWRSGGKFALGYWFDDACCFGAEANYFFLAKGTRQSTVSSSAAPGSPNLIIPFFNASTGLEDSTGLAIPGLYQGTATLKLSNRMQGAELNALMSIPYSCSTSFGLLAGFRWWNFDEHLTFATDSPFIPPNPLDVFTTVDKFHAENNFYGGQIGAKFDYNCDSFFLNVKAKVALGALYQKAEIDGEFVTNDFNGFGTTQTFAGGYFALPSNIGQHTKTRFSVLPEVNVNLGYAVTEHLRLQVGYSFLYVSNVLWAGNQIDRNINPTQSSAINNTPTPVLVGQASPSASLKSESLWVQGLNVGFEFKF